MKTLNWIFVIYLIAGHQFFAKGQDFITKIDYPDIISPDLKIHGIDENNWKKLTEYIEKIDYSNLHCYKETLDETYFLRALSTFMGIEWTNSFKRHEASQYLEGTFESIFCNSDFIKNRDDYLKELESILPNLYLSQRLIIQAILRIDTQKGSRLIGEVWINNDFNNLQTEEVYLKRMRREILRSLSFCSRNPYVLEQFKRLRVSYTQASPYESKLIKKGIIKGSIQNAQHQKGAWNFLSKNRELFSESDLPNDAEWFLTYITFGDTFFDFDPKTMLEFYDTLSEEEKYMKYLILACASHEIEWKYAQEGVRPNLSKEIQKIKKREKEFRKQNADLIGKLHRDYLGKFVENISKL